MGMAASQARYLGLTARKTNVEYEGQQINQARTALANQSGELWNQMLTLSIPTPPSTTQYTTNQYSFSDGFNNFTVSNMEMVDYTDPATGEKYNYAVTYYYNQDTYKAIQEKNSNPQVQRQSVAESDTYSGVTVTQDPITGIYTIDDGTSAFNPDQCTEADAEDLRVLGITNPAEFGSVYKYIDASTGKTAYVDKDELDTLAGSPTPGDLLYNTIETSGYKLGNSQASKYEDATADVVEKAAYDQILNDYPDLAGKEMWVYSKNGKTCFATKDDLEACIASGDTNKPSALTISSTIDYQSPLNQYYASTVSEKIETKEYALLDDASGTGRYSSIKLQSMDTSFDLKAETVTNEKAYNDAMNQYTYDVAVYEKTLSDINAKTKKIQEQDRTLELRLKQLDTEQNALSTEMEAVSGVIDKNVESTFKTFS